MNLPITALVRSVLEKASLEECSEEELRSLIQKYPYYAPAQLLLASKLKYAGKDDYQSELARSSLFFQNPVWFNYLISDDVTTGIIKEDNMVDPGSGEHQDFHQTNGILETGTQEERIESQLPTEITEIAGQREESFTEGTSETEFVSSRDADGDMPREEAGFGAQMTQETVGSETPDGDGLNEISDPSEASPGEIEDQAPPQEPVTSPAVPDGQEYDDLESGGFEPGEEEISERELPGLGDLKIEMTPVDSNVPAFEPLFTVDYFASQGIKSPENDKPTDSFGKQLRSFTEWLKTMKKLSASEIEKSVSAGSEEKVISLAQVSNSGQEVVTETMAEVWTKQGNRQKAREIYHKLSLLNPDKSAYFAAKIEELK